MQKTHRHLREWMHTHTIGEHLRHWTHDPRFWAAVALAILLVLTLGAFFLSGRSNRAVPRFPNYPYVPYLTDRVNLCVQA